MRLIPPQSTITFTDDPVTVAAGTRALLKELVAELVHNDAGREIVMQALVQQIAIRLLRSHARPQRSPDLELSRVGLLDRRIRRSVELMHAQTDQELSLKDLARASYLSPFHFARLFKKLTGVTPHNYLAHIRITHAKQLLTNSNLSITEISVRVGYLSASHFSKAFRLATGTTPRDFRRNLVGRQS
jgi:AraC family transcriptional regulator